MVDTKGGGIEDGVFFAAGIGRIFCLCMGGGRGGEGVCRKYFVRGKSWERAGGGGLVGGMAARDLKRDIVRQWHLFI